MIFHFIILPLPCNSRPWSNFNTAISGKENTIDPCIAPKINHHVSNLIVVRKYWIWLRKNTSKNPASYTGSPTWMIVKEEFLISKSTQKLGVKKRNTPLEKIGFNSFCFTLKEPKSHIPPPNKKQLIHHPYVRSSHPSVRSSLPDGACNSQGGSQSNAKAPKPKKETFQRNGLSRWKSPESVCLRYTVGGKNFGEYRLAKIIQIYSNVFHLTSLQIYSNLMIWGYSLGYRKFGRALEDASHHQGAFTNFDRKKLHPPLSTIASGHTKVPPMASYIIPTMFIHCSGRGIFCASQALKKNGSAVDFVREGQSFQCTEEDFRKQSGWKFLKLGNKSAESILLLYLWRVKQYSNVETKVPCKKNILKQDI